MTIAIHFELVTNSDGKRHNLFFGKAIRDWLNSPTEKFRKFMLNNGHEIVEEIFPTANEEI